MADESNKGITTRPPTMRDIAQACGVNQSTVSRALHRDKRLGQATIDRITAIAEELGYDPMRNQAARRLASMRHGHQMLNNTIGLFFYHKGFSQSAYFTRIHQGILNAISEVDFEIYTSDQFKVTKNLEIPAAYRRGDIDGILAVVEQFWWDKTMSLLRAEPNFGNRPVVGLVDPTPGASSVYADNFGAGRAVAEHLLDLGHRYIMHFHGADKSSPLTHARRLAAIYESFSRRGLDPDKYLVNAPVVEGDPPLRGIEVVKALKSRPEVTAVIAHDDEQAAALYDTLKNAGIRVPADVSLVSYDDTDVILDAHGNNILTTVRLPLFEIGRQGTLLLVRRILGQEPNDLHIEMPTELIVRGSTAGRTEK